MRLPLLIATLLAASVVQSGAVQDAAVLDVRREDEPAYEPYASDGVIVRLAVAAQDAPEGASLRVEPAAGAALVFQGPGGALPYVLRDAVTANEGAVLALPMRSEGTGSVAEFGAVVSPGYVSPPGTYEALLDLTLLSPSGEVLSQLVAVPLGLLVPARAQVVLAGTSGAFDPALSVAFIDLGTLTDGVFRDVFVTVRANTASEITVSSQNGGVLVHDERADQIVPYRIELDGVSAVLTQPLRVTRSPALDWAGTAYPLRVQVDEVGPVFSGTYRDEIVIDVVPH
ncbi:hypothetical protein [Parvularcula dongshanensis]|uniref:Uncharacterized protein n=1 Tax=Parvularcula dongshanensis TaxID=1173995 RepID=A0A840I433_9PROT|nr:hypothetical protein [Parvularcula dongshanensis]MBB4658928.1 hypothetical protein [Parvularcula dongshanensis]